MQPSDSSASLNCLSGATAYSASGLSDRSVNRGGAARGPGSAMRNAVFETSWNRLSDSRYRAMRRPARRIRFLIGRHRCDGRSLR
jgi:hypothetical protein